MNTPVLVSIVINNFNYARFLGAAIDSALAQSYPHTEVIVVDDGSTDASQPVIASYGERVVAVLQENGGQAAALNAGLARAQGSVVFFLDADDVLHPDIAARVVAAFEANPQAVRVQFRLAVIDAAGEPTGATMPAHAEIPHGDLRRALLDYGDDIPWLPTSGNAFAMSMLRQIFPIPVAPYRICADYYLSNLSPLFGEVMALEQVGGYYRVHGVNHHEGGQVEPERVRQNIVRTAQTHQYIAATAQRPGLLRAAGFRSGKVRVGRLSVMVPANRLVSLRLDWARHPLPDDTRLGLMRQGIWAALHHPRLSLLHRLLYVAWFVLVAVVPGPGAVRALAEALFFPGAYRQRWQRRLDMSQWLRPAQRYKQRVSE